MKQTPNHPSVLVLFAIFGGLLISKSYVCIVTLIGDIMLHIFIPTFQRDKRSLLGAPLNQPYFTDILLYHASIQMTLLLVLFATCRSLV